MEWLMIVAIHLNDANKAPRLLETETIGGFSSEEKCRAAIKQVGDGIRAEIERHTYMLPQKQRHPLITARCIEINK